MPGRLSTYAPLVSLVIPCRNEAKGIEKCLQSILRQDFPVGGLEIIVADGLSEDGTWDILEKIVNDAATSPAFNLSAVNRPAAIRIIRNPDRIVSRGLNAAIRSACGAIIIRMDSHTDYAPDYVRRCVETLEQTKADNVGGPARTIATDYLGKAIAAAYHSAFAVGGARFHNVEYEGWVDTVTYGCWRKETFDRFGLFDEELARNQDDEHNLRIIRGGGKVWQSPKIRSWYHPRGSLASLFKQYMQYGYWKVRVIQKHKLPASPRHLVPGAFVLALALCLVATALGYWLAATFDLPSAIYRVPLNTLLLAIVLYGLCVFTASLATAAKTEWKLFPVLPFVFATYHFSYGCGFLCGAWDFVIHGGKRHATFESLTR